MNIARNYTMVEGADSLRAFLDGIAQNRSRVLGRPSTAQTLAHNLYGIVYQFYKNKLHFERHIHKDLFLRFLDRFLQPDHQEEDGLFDRLHHLWHHRKPPREDTVKPDSVGELLRAEAQRLIWNDPQLMSIVKNGNGSTEHQARKWFQFVHRVSDKVLYHFGNHLLDHISGANVFNVFHSIGSAGALYSVLAPYFVAFSLFTKDRQLSQQVRDHFTRDEAMARETGPSIKVAHFTDTYYEVNGVAITLQQQVRMALKTGKRLKVITCDEGNRDETEGVRNFKPVGVYGLPEYPEQKLFFPPLLEMLNYCYEEDFTHIHSATPGPIGLAAFAIARILRLPFSGTYHTALPQYARYLTEDGNIEDLVWRFTLWYYDHMDFIYAPSESTANELIHKGIGKEKLRFFPRGVDTERFHPSKRNTKRLQERYQITAPFRLLYVGRISKEKNLHLLGEAFKSLCSIHSGMQLVMVGDGPYLPELREAMEGTPCVFTGYREGEELAGIYASCDLFIFPSTTDTFGNVVLEAQASGLPVVVTDSGGPQENMVHGETGLIVRGDDPISLRRAIQSFITNPERLKHMGTAAREYVEGRSFQQAFDATWDMYRDRTVPTALPMAQAV